MSVVFITGASSGIGKATVRLFAQKGWDVVASMRIPNGFTEFDKYEKVRLVACDVNDLQSVKKAIANVVDIYGKIDVVINNAGFAVVGVFEEAQEEIYYKQFETNVFGVMRVISCVLPVMRKARGGVIVTVSSMGGRITFPMYSLYHASKWAVEGFVESLQYEVALFGVRLKLIEPGPIQTDFYTRSLTVIDSVIPDYKDYARKALPRMNKPGNKRESPEIVAKTIYKSVVDKSQRLRYPAGYIGSMLLTLRKVLPERIFNRFIEWFVLR